MENKKKYINNKELSIMLKEEHMNNIIIVKSQLTLKGKIKNQNSETDLKSCDPGPWSTIISSVRSLHLIMTSRLPITCGPISSVIASSHLSSELNLFCISSLITVQLFSLSHRA